MSYIFYILKIAILLPLTLLLIIIIIKFLNKYQYKSNLIEIIDRVPVGPNCFLMIVKIVDKIYVMSTSNTNCQLLFELTEPININNTIHNRNLIHDLNIINLLKRGTMKNEKDS
ncbi:flagellar biosynthetic protein FliO [Thermobrachium celere]|uniref:flagellar biosynthetic protein FliO n=1 Tax=Thermobrachium celere TaxID=53422 RepID=UPI0019444021|nr:flagellar biosynthetic protein FliO [Thermobrachium celere]GFR35595.1 hypothetical protein TCEA9_14070 [Thermobrachium celere]